jgi:transcriptional regulator with XRE-family HTH domain
LNNRRLDQATFQALQALIAHGQLRVSDRLARAVRQRREALDLSVKDIAEACGIELMEVRDIENGSCTMSAPMLVQLARAIEVDLVWFIEQEPGLFSSVTRGRAPEKPDPLAESKEGLELVRAFQAIKDPAARKAVLRLAQTFAENGTPDQQRPNPDDPS